LTAYSPPSVVTRTSGETYFANALVSPVVEWEAEQQSAAGVSSSIWRALRLGAVHVCETWDCQGEGGSSPDEVRAAASVLCDTVRQYVAGESPAVHVFPAALPAPRLLDALRRSFLVRVQECEEHEHLDLGQVLRVFGAMDSVRMAMERDSAQRFLSRLSGPDAIQLVVEVAHDMRSPLGSILFLAERLRNAQSGPVNQIQERQLGLVYSAALGLSSLASDVIELARGGDRLVDRNPIPFSMSQLMQSVRAIVQPIAEEKGLAMRFTPPATDFRIGYPTALNRVLLNLTTNALKFTTDGSVEVVALQTARHRIEFSVQDTGRGIPPQVMATLFDAFRRRVKPGEYFFSSAGLGLSICRKLIEAMGGTLTVKSAPETGTRFSFELELPPAPAM